MKISLSDNFSYGRLLRFTLPSVLMMVWTSLYGVVDGYFVSNRVGETAFAAINFIMPFLMILGAIGFVIGAGGTALVSMTMGRGEDRRAREIFSMLIYFLIGAGVVISAAGIIFIEPAARLLGASDLLLPYCVSYGRIILCALTFYMLQNVFQNFLVTAERPRLGLAVMIIAGVMNMALDALFIAVFDWGVRGAAAATAISQLTGGAIPLLYFIFPNKSRVGLCRAKLELMPLAKACANGVSEFMSCISMSVVNMLYNFQLMRLVGEKGVAAYGVLMYVSFIFVSVFLGYSIGCAPVVGFKWGARDTPGLSGVFKKSLVIIGGATALMLAAGYSLAVPMSKFFVGYDKELFDMTVRALRYYLSAVTLIGFNIYASAFFTALNNGLISAIISFARTLVFEVGAVLILPLILGITGIWLSCTAAEIFAAALSCTFLVANRKKYGYF
ncbi:MAG: MATE family efflux transporter [Clostridia bacterium]|nr:MATE family efflux transporter [Clostridia bacterium]